MRGGGDYQAPDAASIRSGNHLSIPGDREAGTETSASSESRTSNDDCPINSASSVNLVERLLLDSQGRLFKATSATVVKGLQSIILDVGTSRRRYSFEVAEQYRPSWQQIQELALEQVRSSSSVWAGDARAVAACARCAALKLNRTSRESWNWTR